MSDQGTKRQQSFDRQRQAVYTAERSMAQILRYGGTVETHGSSFTVEAERVFADIDSIQAYVDAVLTFGPIASMPGADRPVTVRNRRGHMRAHYEPENCTIAIPTDRDGRWTMRESVVLHELAHHLNPERANEPVHGPTFAATLIYLFERILSPEAAAILRVGMWERGVTIAGGTGGTGDPTATGSAARAGSGGGSTILDKLSKVLTQAERATTREEANAFFERAQAMATRYSIDLAVARQHVAQRERREQPVHRRIFIGERRRSGNRQFVKLFLAIARANDITSDIASDSTAVYPYGFPSDLDVAEAMYAYLSTHMAVEAEKYLATGAYKDVTMWSKSKRQRVPVTARTARLAFYDSYISTIETRLQAAKEQAEAAAIAQDAAASRTTNESGETRTALVLAEKRKEVKSYYKAKSTAKGSWGGFRATSTATVGSASKAGREAGNNARLTATRALPSAAKAVS